MARAGRVEEARQLLRRYRTALRLAGTLGVRGQRAEDVRDLADFLPLTRPVKRGAADGQDSINAARPGAALRQPPAKLTLLVGRDVSNCFTGPEFLPVR